VLFGRRETVTHEKRVNICQQDVSSNPCKILLNAVGPRSSTPAGSRSFGIDGAAIGDAHPTDGAGARSGPQDARGSSISSAAGHPSDDGERLSLK
jgi:hypothetical protein